MDGLARSRRAAIRIAVVVLALVMALPFRPSTPVLVDVEITATGGTKLFNHDYRPALIVPRSEREQRVRERLKEPEPIFAGNVAAIPVLDPTDPEGVSLIQADQDASESTVWRIPRQRPSSPRAPPALPILS